METERVSHKIELASGKTITVSKPIIDFISFTVTGKSAIESKVKATSGDWNAEAAEYWTGFYNRVLEEFKQSESIVTSTNGRSPHYHILAKLDLGNGEFAKLQTKPKAKTTAPARLEFNPSRLSSGAMERLAKAWDVIDYYNFPLPSLMADARITRLDIAVDCEGISPVDIFVYNKKVWKIWTATTFVGGAQTAYYYETASKAKSPHVSPKKRADFMVYDKRVEQIANGIEPIFGEAEHTRLELSISKKCLFKSLATMPFAFANWKIIRTLIDSPPYEGWIWKLVWDSARYRSFDVALDMLPKEITEDVVLTGNVHAPTDLVTEDDTWSHWKETLENSHVGQLISWAETDVSKFLPDYSVLNPEH